MKKIALHIQILIGIAAAPLFAFACVKQDWLVAFVLDYVKPCGGLFLNSLKVVAMPLVVASLLLGIARLPNSQKLSRVTRKAGMLYVATTVVSATIGLCMANLTKPGAYISEATRHSLLALYETNVQHLQVQDPLQQMGKKGISQTIATLMPENFFQALSNNGNLLQVVVVTLLLGVALLKVPTAKRMPVIAFFDGIHEAMIQCIRLAMNVAPLGVFALTTALLVELAVQNHAVNLWEVLHALLGYVGTVLGGLLLVVGLFYPIVLRFFTSMPFFHFLRGIYPAQVLAFSSSSSAATLPVSMESVENNLGVSEEISGLVLPLGAAINMNGTVLYQAVLCVFVAQAMGIELSVGSQLLLIGNASVASLGVAGAPGSALVTTLALLESVGIPAAGLTLILAPDRLLDMCRTVVNVTGDALAAVAIAQTEAKISPT